MINYRQMTPQEIQATLNPPLTVLTIESISERDKKTILNIEADPFGDGGKVNKRPTKRRPYSDLLKDTRAILKTRKVYVCPTLRTKPLFFLKQKFLKLCRTVRCTPNLIILPLKSLLSKVRAKKTPKAK